MGKHIRAMTATAVGTDVNKGVNAGASAGPR